MRRNSILSMHLHICRFFVADALNESERKLDSCIVSIYPSLNPDHEALTLPEARLQQFNILAKISKDGASISGAEFLHSYELVIVRLELLKRFPLYFSRTSHWWNQDFDVGRGEKSHFRILEKQNMPQTACSWAICLWRN